MAKKIEGKEVIEEVQAPSPVRFERHAQLIVSAPFELERNFQKIEYKEGDVFPLPEGWTRDTAFEEFRKIGTDGKLNGLSFSVPKPILDEKGKLKYMDSRRVLLPLKEA